MNTRKIHPILHRRFPLHWLTVKFGEIAEFKNGINFKSNEKGNMIKILGVGDFGNLSLIRDMSLLSQVPLEKLPSEKFLLKNGDLVFVRSNGTKKLVGRCLLVYPEDEIVSFSGFTIRARLKTDLITPEFISQLMQGGLLRLALRHEGRGTNISNLNQSMLSNLIIPIPPKYEQDMLLSLITEWDAALKKTWRLIIAKEERFCWLIHSLINNRCNDWNHIPTHEIFDTISEKKNDNEELLSVTQDHGVIPRTVLEGRVMSPEGSTDSYKLIRKGDFAVSLRSFQGGIEYSQYQGIISPAYTVLRPKIKLHDDFYRHFFKSYIFIEKYLSISVIGIRDGKQISIPDFMTLKLPYPPMEEQKSISAILNNAHQEIDLLKQQAEAYRKQKRGLMQKLLTGQWRVVVEERVKYGE
ncbi:MAG: restriction endonuclease subunit S [Syntrophomonas sp.]|nr:restriction endonuclease subunit S [Syntrophomonas sp.]